MPNFSFLQQVPEDCTQPVTIGAFQVSLIDIEPFGTGYRWIYRIDSAATNRTALSNWVLAIDEDCLPLIGQCYISELFTGDVTQDVLNSLAPYENCLQGPEPAPRECENTFPEGSPCDVEGRLEGFKFDSLPGGLALGNSQLFAFTVNQPPIIEIGCAALSYGTSTFCGEICVPGCVVCENPCECPEEENTFDVTVALPSECFAFTGTGEGGTTLPEDIRFGYCIGEATDTGPVTCEAPAEVFVCGQTIVCCCEVNSWTREVPLDIQFNIPKTAECLSGNIGEGEFLYECFTDTPTVTQTCFTCQNVTESPFVPAEDLDCTNVTITVNTVTDNGNGTATINYTVNLPECIEPDDDEEPPASEPPVDDCPPPSSNNRAASNKPTINNTFRRIFRRI